MADSGLQYLMMGLIWVLNVVISYFNARGAGLAWVESKAVGGWPRFMVWMAAIMAAAGFSWCILIFLALGGYHLHYITALQAEMSIKLGYLVLVPEILVVGLVITVDSWAQAFRSGRWQDYGVAIYNTTAQLSNTYEAFNNYGEILGDVLGYFSNGGKSSKDRSSSDSKDNDSNGGAAMIVLLVVAALGAGIILTVMIIRQHAGSIPMTSPKQLDPDRDWGDSP